MFESLSDRLNGVFGKLTSRGRLSEKDIDAALREVRMALLEADVDFKVARQFIKDIKGLPFEPYPTFREGSQYQQIIDLIRRNDRWVDVSQLLEDQAST